MKNKKTHNPNSVHHLMAKFNKFRIYSLSLAESLDAWRIIPRIMLIAYSLLVVNMYVWYKSIPTYVQEKCDAAVVDIFIKNHSTIEDAQKAACSVQAVVGGPTPAQTALVTTIIGLSSLIFGFYANSGRKWENGMPEELARPRALPPPPPPYNGGPNPPSSC